MNEMVAETESEPTSVEEVESAIRLLRKLIDEVDRIEDPLQKAPIVSNLYRTFQELSKELRSMREFALLDAGLVFAAENSDGTERYFSDDEEHPLAYHHIVLGFDRLYRMNRSFVMQKADGKPVVLDPFNGDHEPKRIAERLRRRVKAALRGERDWEGRHGRPFPHPRYPKYANR